MTRRPHPPVVLPLESAAGDSALEFLLKNIVKYRHPPLLFD